MLEPSELASDAYDIRPDTGGRFVATPDPQPWRQPRRSRYQRDLSLKNTFGRGKSNRLDHPCGREAGLAATLTSALNHGNNRGDREVAPPACEFLDSVSSIGRWNRQSYLT